ncbi:MAG: hypothetical protein KF812_02070 [Fimbriimonadaceae bacterium]|nr:hypothetical protein [Fimbriimonadaceae bacterium]
MRNLLLLLAGATLALTPAQTGINPFAAYFRDAEAAYALLPPVDLGFDNVAGIQPIGKKLFVFQFDSREPFLDVPVPETQGVLRASIYDPVSRRKTAITGIPFETMNFEVVSLGQSIAVLKWINVIEGEWTTITFLLSLDSGRGQRINHPQIEVAEISASGRLLALVSQMKIYVYDMQGNLVRERGIEGLTFPIYGSREGLVIMGREGPRGPMKVLRYDVDNDRFTEVEPEQINQRFTTTQADEGERNGFFVNAMPHSSDFLDGDAGGLVRIGTYLAARQLESNEPRSPLPHERPRFATVTGGASNVLLFNDDRILILQSRRLLERKIEEVDLDQYKIAVVEDVKRKAMGQAKQLGTAAHIYAADYDDHFPMSGDWQSMLDPYSRNRSIFDNAVITTNGENISEIDRICEFVMGWVQTPYGRAVIRGDSSVRWIPNP